MTRPYEMPYYPIPAVLGIALNLLLSVVFVWFNPQTLVFGAVWIGLGVVAYVGLNRYRSEETGGTGAPTAGGAAAAGETDTQMPPEEDD
jgi:hypothetical protein